MDISIDEINKRMHILANAEINRNSLKERIEELHKKLEVANDAVRAANEGLNSYMKECFRARVATLTTAPADAA